MNKEFLLSAIPEKYKDKAYVGLKEKKDNMIRFQLCWNDNEGTKLIYCTVFEDYFNKIKAELNGIHKRTKRKDVY